MSPSGLRPVIVVNLGPVLSLYSHTEDFIELLSVPSLKQACVGTDGLGFLF